MFCLSQRQNVFLHQICWQKYFPLKKSIVPQPLFQVKWMYHGMLTERAVYTYEVKGWRYSAASWCFVSVFSTASCILLLLHSADAYCQLVFVLPKWKGDTVVGWLETTWVIDVPIGVVLSLDVPIRVVLSLDVSIWVVLSLDVPIGIVLSLNVPIGVVLSLDVPIRVVLSLDESPDVNTTKINLIYDSNGIEIINRGFLNLYGDLLRFGVDIWHLIKKRFWCSVIRSPK